MIQEEWKPIEGYEGLYEVSDFGRVRRLRNWQNGIKVLNTKILKPSPMSNGYLTYHLCKGNKVKVFMAHRLVADAFIPNPNNLSQVNHKDEDKSNNRVCNLEWCSPRYNLYYSKVPQKMKAAAVKACEKQVEMYDKDWHFIRIFESLTKAADFIGGFQQNVSICCYNPEKTCKGYHFKFV